MKHVSVACFLAVSLCLAPGAADCAAADRSGEAGASSSNISSRVEKTDAGGRTLIEEIIVDASVGAVWDAYTTAEGWRGWAAPVAQVDLRPGGTIRTHYGPDAKIDDPGTIVLHIVNLVPRRILTLRADPQDNWPEAMKRDAEHLMNIIVFDALPDHRTRITSYGVGYGAAPEYDKLLGFVSKANRGLYEKLIAYLEAERDTNSSDNR